MKNIFLSGVLAVTLSAILWGFDGVVLTPRLAGIDIVLIVFLLHAIPFVLMNLFLFRETKKLKTLTKKDWFYFGLVALFGGALGTICIVKALISVQFMPFSIVILLQKLQPIFAIILAAILLKEKISPRFLLFGTIALIASYTLSFGFQGPQVSNIQAVLYALLAAFSFGSATVFGKKVLQKYEFQTATYIRFGLTTLITLFVVLVLGVHTGITQITNFQWMIFVIIAITTGSGAIFLYYWGLKRIPAKVATMCELAMPVSVIVFDYIINDRVLTLIQWMSAIVLIFAVSGIVRIQKKKEIKQE